VLRIDREIHARAVPRRAQRIGMPGKRSHRTSSRPPPRDGSMRAACLLTKRFARETPRSPNRPANLLPWW
jgi:hypothetical protein